MERTYSAYVEVRSRQTGEEYKGTFSMRRPDLSDMGAISAAMSRMNQGEPFVSNSYEAIFLAVCTVAVCGAGTRGESVPDWWEGVVEAPTDTQVVMACWARITEERDKSYPFRSEKDQKEASSDEPPLADSAGTEG